MPRKVAHEALQRVRRSPRARAAEQIETLSELSSLAPRDRDLARELALGVLRTQDALDAVLVARMKRPIDKQSPATLDVLRLGAYQLLCLDRIPARAAVHSSVELAKSIGSAKAAGFTNAVLRAVASRVEGVADADCPPRRSLPRGDGAFVVYADDIFADPEEDLIGHLATRWSHPRWLVERVLDQHGEEATRAWLSSGATRPALSLRPVKGHRDDLIAALTAAGKEFEPEGLCLLLHGGGSVTELPGFAEGWFAVQDPTSADVVAALAPQAGSGVLDLCAAPGGKTLSLAEAVGHAGVVLAVDRSETRLVPLRSELARRKLENVAVVVGDCTLAGSLPAGLVESSADKGFDAAVVDVPCSNTGVLGRRVEVRHRLVGPEIFETLAAQARKMLGVALSRVHAGGRVVYSTCSIDNEENTWVVRAAIGKHRGARLVEQRLTLPVPGRRDGGFLAVIKVG